jgi:hypothetical protein
MVAQLTRPSFPCVLTGVVLMQSLCLDCTDLQLLPEEVTGVEASTDIESIEIDSRPTSHNISGLSQRSKKQTHHVSSDQESLSRWPRLTIKNLILILKQIHHPAQS